MKLQENLLPLPSVEPRQQASHYDALNNQGLLDARKKPVMFFDVL
jgi:hypothetical protein